MRKFLIGGAIFTILAVFFTGFLLYNHNQLPTKDDVFKWTKKMSFATNNVYFVNKIDDKWFTIFGDNASFSIARLEQNLIGNWELKGISTVVVNERPEEKVDFTWVGSGELVDSGENENTISYYFGQILNPEIKKILVETVDNFFEEAYIIETEGLRFFFIRSDKELNLPVTIQGFSETGELIYTTYKLSTPPHFFREDATFHFYLPFSSSLLDKGCFRKDCCFYVKCSFRIIRV